MKLQKFKIKNKTFTSYRNVLIIGEIGSNHDGNFQKLKNLVLNAKKAGCDAVKFQLFKSDMLISKKHPAQTILKKNELKITWLKKIKKLCVKNNILFICSPFYLEAVDELKKIGCDGLKVASPEIKNIPLLKKIKKSNLPVIISTGDSNYQIIKRALTVFKGCKNENIAILHCISQYPAKERDINLNNIIYLKEKFKINIGFSDHTLGSDASMMAVGMGVNIIEKHITLNKNRIL